MLNYKKDTLVVQMDFTLKQEILKPMPSGALWYTGNSKQLRYYIWKVADVLTRFSK